MRSLRHTSRHVLRALPNGMMSSMMNTSTPMMSSTSSRQFSTRSPLTKGFVTPKLTVPRTIEYPDYAASGRPKDTSNILCSHDPSEYPAVRNSARLARKMLDYALSLAVPGISTDEIDRRVHAAIVEAGAYPSPLNYAGFPKSICTSVNEVICHGIPDSTILQDGDVVSIDVSLFFQGYHGDNCGTVVVGEGTESSKRLVQTTYEAVDRAIAICKPGVCISEIGRTIEEFASERGYSIVGEFCGHGTGRHLHMKPLIIHYHEPAYKFTLQEGMVFTIEPILVEGDNDIHQWADGWTAVTSDQSWGAQVEHEILITADGAEILTLPEDKL